jgi:SWI/SNF-related matrix-associated actin-dependent regulator 1 of chromatin subfamily A
VVDLREYQHRGAAFLAAHKRALLGDQMGLGKSAQAIVAADLVGASSVLVICPASVRPHWPSEFARWSRRAWRPQVVTTTSETLDPAADLIVCSYATARAPAIFAQLMARRFDVLVLDEVQNCRTGSAQQTRAVYGRRGDGAGALLERAEHCWGLSGSIAPNGWARELYPHLRAFDVTNLTAQGFDHRFHVLKPTPWGDVPIAHRNMPELQELLRPVYLRRRIEDVAQDLPALRTTTTPIEADVRALLAAEASPALAELQAALAAGEDAEVLALLEHASGDTVARLRHGTGMLKVPGALALLRDELETDPAHKVVVFAVHRAVLAGLAEGLADFGAVLLDGATRPKDRQSAIDRFASDPACRVFVAQIVAAGSGSAWSPHTTWSWSRRAGRPPTTARPSPAAAGSVRPSRCSRATCTCPDRSTRRSAPCSPGRA